jgi:hypothetical protein
MDKFVERFVKSMTSAKHQLMHYRHRSLIHFIMINHYRVTYKIYCIRSHFLAR